MANASELTIRMATLEERVNNHIKFFWMAFAVGFAWMAVISYALYNLNDTAHRIEKTQTEAFGKIKSDLSPLLLNAQSSLSPDTFQATLPKLREALSTAQQEHLPVSPKVIIDLQERLTASANSPEFWPTAAAFINYRSQASLPGFQTVLPRCVDHDPSGQVVIAVPDQHHMLLTHGTYENCRFEMDSPADDAKLNWLLINRFSSGIIFKHCLITYDGGPINLILAIYNQHVTYTGEASHATFEGTINTSSTLQFSGCLFQLLLTEPPPDKGQDFTRTVLASQGQTVVLGITAEKS